MVEKVGLDRIAAEIVQEVARRENRTASNAASTLIRRAWIALQDRTKERDSVAIQ